MMERKPDGYLKDWKNIRLELEKIIGKNKGQLPGEPKLRDLGYGYLVNAIYHHHDGLPAVRQRLGLDPLRRPARCWQKWEDILPELEKIMKENGRYIPSPKKLEALGYGYLVHAICRYHGGFIAVRQKLGLQQIHGHLQEWENVRLDLEKIMKENGGALPSSNKLRESGYGSLVQRITQSQGGMIAVRKKLGLDQLISPPGYLQDWENVRLELKKIMKENGGDLPSSIKLGELGYGSLLCAIGKYHGGLAAVRQKLKLKQLICPKNYLKDWRDLLPELKRVMEENGGALPLSNKFGELGYSYLLTAIYKHHGGLSVVRRKLQGEGILNSEKKFLEDVLLDYVQKDEN